MTEYLTTANALLLISVLGNLYALLRWIAPRTQTTVDDRAVEILARAEAWAQAYAPTAWEYLELAQKRGMLPAGTAKAVEFVLMVRDAYRKEHGAELPAQAEQVAIGVAAGMSAAEKLSRPADPQPAPVSR